MTLVSRKPRPYSRLVAFRPLVSVAALLVVVTGGPAFGSEYKSKKPLTKDYRGIRRRGNAGPEDERRHLLEAAQQLRDRSYELSAKAEVLDDKGRDEAADDLRERAEEAAEQARRLEDQADELRLPSAIRRGTPRHSIESTP